jgi:hypothetical protein
MSVCKSCDAPIRWVKMAATGKSMPLDVQRSASGNIVLDEKTGLGGFALPGDERPRYVSHFATCPNAKQHRRR